MAVVDRVLSIRSSLQVGVGEPDGKAGALLRVREALPQPRSCVSQAARPKHRKSVLHALAHVAGQPAAARVTDSMQQAVAQAGEIWVRCRQGLHSARQLDGSKYVGRAPCQKYRPVAYKCVQAVLAAHALGQPCQVLAGSRFVGLAKSLPVWVYTNNLQVRQAPYMQKAQ